MADTTTATASISRDICSDFARSSLLEWLQTNHTGAFAMGTAAGVNTRRYHGLLIASLNPPADRNAILSRVEEIIETDDQSFHLGVVQYPGVVSPRGFDFLDEFSPSPFPQWRFRCGRLSVEKSIRLLDGEQTIVLSYTADAPCKMQLRPFLAFRDYHSLTRQNSSFNTSLSEQAGCLSIRPYATLPPLTFYHPQSFEADGVWFNNHEYLREMERGLDFREDLYSPGIFHFEIAANTPVHLIATLETKCPAPNIAPIYPIDPLTAALDQFRVFRADKRPTLIAGYPWFTDWSRDTLISLPAFLAIGYEPEHTRSVLEFLLAERKQGILPNRFPDRESTPEYNTVDASLWFFIAAAAYIDSSGDLDFLQNTLFSAAEDILDWHRRGTFYNIQVDSLDHLLSAGQEGVQLTWMDAKIGDFVVTPRIGKPVEINALWFNALQITSRWAGLLSDHDRSEHLLEEALQVQRSFIQKFWNPARQCLFDVVTSTLPDESLRPNQLFSVSLPYPLLDRTRAQSVVQIVREHLLTPAGLRTLEPGDPHYCPRFEGDMRSRDSAYHQGTVWSWLIGPYVDAYLYAFNGSQEAREHCRSAVDSVTQLMNGYCLGSIGEVFDAAPPHHPGGCPAQLWSVAQTILALQRLKQPD